MDLGTTITGLIVLLICIIPFVLMTINIKRRKQLLNSVLNNFAIENNSTIEQFETWNNRAIGIDSTSNQLFFVEIVDNCHVFQNVNLIDIVKCSVVKSSKNNDTTDMNMIDQVKLQLKNKDQNKPHTELVLFQSGIGATSLTGEISIANKWKTIISSSL